MEGTSPFLGAAEKHFEPVTVGGTWLLSAVISVHQRSSAVRKDRDYF